MFQINLELRCNARFAQIPFHRWIIFVQEAHQTRYIHIIVVIKMTKPSAKMRKKFVKLKIIKLSEKFFCKWKMVQKWSILLGKKCRVQRSVPWDESNKFNIEYSLLINSIFHSSNFLFIFFYQPLAFNITRFFSLCIWVSYFIRFHSISIGCRLGSPKHINIYIQKKGSLLFLWFHIYIPRRRFNRLSFYMTSQFTIILRRNIEISLEFIENSFQRPLLFIFQYFSL